MIGIYMICGASLGIEYTEDAEEGMNALVLDLLFLRFILFWQKKPSA